MLKFGVFAAASSLRRQILKPLQVFLPHTSSTSPLVRLWQTRGRTCLRTSMHQPPFIHMCYESLEVLGEKGVSKKMHGGEPSGFASGEPRGFGGKSPRLRGESFPPI